MDMENKNNDFTQSAYPSKIKSTLKKTQPLYQKSSWKSLLYFVALFYILLLTIALALNFKYNNFVNTFSDSGFLFVVWFVIPSVMITLGAIVKGEFLLRKKKGLQNILGKKLYFFIFNILILPFSAGLLSFLFGIIGGSTIDFGLEGFGVFVFITVPIQISIGLFIYQIIRIILFYFLPNHGLSVLYVLEKHLKRVNVFVVLLITILLAGVLFDYTTDGSLHLSGDRFVYERRLMLANKYDDVTRCRYENFGFQDLFRPSRLESWDVRQCEIGFFRSKVKQQILNEEYSEVFVHLRDVQCIKFEKKDDYYECKDFLANSMKQLVYSELENSLSVPPMILGMDNIFFRYRVSDYSPTIIFTFSILKDPNGVLRDRLKNLNNEIWVTTHDVHGINLSYSIEDFINDKNKFYTLFNRDIKSILEDAGFSANVPSINKTLPTNTPSVSASEQYASLLAEQCPKLRADKGNYTEYYNCKQDIIRGMEFVLINELKRKLSPHQTLELKRLDLGEAPSRILFEFKNKDSSGSYTLGDLQERADRTNSVISAQIRQGGVLGESLVNTASARASVMENSVWLSYSTETILSHPEEFYAFWSAEIVPIFYE